MEESRRCVLSGQEIKRQFPPISTAGFVIQIDCDVILFCFALPENGTNVHSDTAGKRALMTHVLNTEICRPGFYYCTLCAEMNDHVTNKMQSDENSGILQAMTITSSLQVGLLLLLGVQHTLCRRHRYPTGVQ